MNLILRQIWCAIAHGKRSMYFRREVVGYTESGLPYYAEIQGYHPCSKCGLE